MKRDERKRKFNEAIVNMLYPSPPQPDPSPPQLEQELEPLESLIEGSGTDVISGTLDDYENASTSGEDHNSETEKLTRAQRKKIRKKKLKEEAIRRGKLIGPMLPLTLNPTSECECECDHEVAEDAPAVRSNASVEGSGADEPGNDPACGNSKKMKHRRMGKKAGQRKANRLYFGELQSKFHFKFCC